MTTPRCPRCNAQGLGHLKPHDAGLFLVVYCDKCGAIYGLVPKPQQLQPVQQTPATEALATSPEPEPQPEPEIDSAPPPRDEKEQPLTPHRAYLLQRHFIQHATPYLKIVDLEGQVMRKEK